MLCAVAAVVTLLAIPPRRSSDYVLTEAQEAMVRASFKSQRFPTASEAAYAASLNYGRAFLTVEVGAKIYVDVIQGAVVYSYGPAIYGQSDDESGEEEILYDPRSNDGHFQLVGFWHEHPSPDDWLSLYGHYAQIDQTHQTVWTTIRRDVFVQFWDGTRAMPTWSSAVPAIQPIARV
jgi:hypothetical protein